MFIRKAKYHNDISEAYVRGLEQGFELSRNLKRVRKKREQDLLPPLNMYQPKEASLLSSQLSDIAERKKFYCTNLTCIFRD